MSAHPDPSRAPGTDVDQSVMGLAGRWWRHVLALLDHKHGIEPLDRDGVGQHALAALDHGTRLAADLGRWRPTLVVDALAAGVDHARVAVAAGFASPDELRCWLRDFADEQHRLGYLDDARHAEVRALAERTDRGAGS